MVAAPPQPRQISFTATCQYVLASWMLLSCGLIPASQLVLHCHTMLRHIAAREVANRPGRLEPRVLKRRKHGDRLMQQPRETLRAELPNHCTQNRFGRDSAIRTCPLTRRRDSPVNGYVELDRSMLGHQDGAMLGRIFAVECLFGGKRWIQRREPPDGRSVVAVAVH